MPIWYIYCTKERLMVERIIFYIRVPKLNSRDDTQLQY